MFNRLLGKDLVTIKVDEKWGSGVVEQVSLDLQNEFPSAKGFSTINLWNMKKWYLFYSEKLQQPVGETDFPAIFAFVPWGHHVQIITKCKDMNQTEVQWAFRGLETPMEL